MRYLTPSSIRLIEDVPFHPNAFVLDIPCVSNWGDIPTLSQTLMERGWDHTEENEQKIFTEIFKNVLNPQKQMVIRQIITKHPLIMLETLYRSLGYYSDTSNNFILPLQTCPIVVSVSIRALYFSHKNTPKEERTSLIQTPDHPCALIKAVNKGLIPWVELEKSDLPFLQILIER